MFRLALLAALFVLFAAFAGNPARACDQQLFIVSQPVVPFFVPAFSQPIFVSHANSTFFVTPFGFHNSLHVGQAVVFQARPSRVIVRNGLFNNRSTVIFRTR